MARRSSSQLRAKNAAPHGQQHRRRVPGGCGQELSESRQGLHRRPPGGGGAQPANQRHTAEDQHQRHGHGNQDGPELVQPPVQGGAELPQGRQHPAHRGGEDRAPHQATDPGTGGGSLIDHLVQICNQQPALAAQDCLIGAHNHRDTRCHQHRRHRQGGHVRQEGGPTGHAVLVQHPLILPQAHHAQHKAEHPHGNGIAVEAALHGRLSGQEIGDCQHRRRDQRHDQPQDRHCPEIIPDLIPEGPTESRVHL